MVNIMNPCHGNEFKKTVVGTELETFPCSGSRKGGNTKTKLDFPKNSRLILRPTDFPFQNSVHLQMKRLAGFPREPLRKLSSCSLVVVITEYWTTQIIELIYFWDSFMSYWPFQFCFVKYTEICLKLS